MVSREGIKHVQEVRVYLLSAAVVGVVTCQHTVLLCNPAAMDS